MAEALENNMTLVAYNVDKDAMEAADAFVYVLPCGRSASLELGWAAGRGIPTAIMFGDDNTPEVMYRLADRFCTTLQEVLDWLSDLT